MPTPVAPRLDLWGTVAGCMLLKGQAMLFVPHPLTSPIAVQVRVLTDDDCSKNEGSDIDRFRTAGTPVLMDNSPAHMHHKVKGSDGDAQLGGPWVMKRTGATGGLSSSTQGGLTSASNCAVCDP